MNISRIDPTLGLRFESLSQEPHAVSLAQAPFRDHMRSQEAPRAEAPRDASANQRPEPSRAEPRVSESRDEPPLEREEQSGEDPHHGQTDSARPDTESIAPADNSASEDDSPEEGDRVTLSEEAEEKLSDNEAEKVEETAEVVAGTVQPPAVAGRAEVEELVRDQEARQDKVAAESEVEPDGKQASAGKTEVAANTAAQKPTATGAVESLHNPTSAETRQTDAPAAAATVQNEESATVESQKQGLATQTIESAERQQALAEKASAAAAEGPPAEKQRRSATEHRSAARESKAAADPTAKNVLEPDKAAEAKPVPTAAAEKLGIHQASAVVVEVPTAEKTGGEASAESSPASKSELAATQASGERTQGVRLAEKLLAQGTARRDGTGEVRQADQARFVQRVAGAFARAQQRDGEIRLRLSPPELGSLRLQLKIEDGVMTARLEAESSAARGLLLENLPSLRERLAEQNIRIDRFEVELQQDSQSGTGPGQQRDRQAADHPGSGGRPRATPTADHQAVASPSQEPVNMVSDKQINIVV